ncbi:MAG: transcriptional regulator [Actinobacteria bacterium HGW-Actinobacteria-6]|nr:MAG: transcriptional regulator [Actinobacteria bacterium HGW-Actinobacteria-6]
MWRVAMGSKRSVPSCDVECVHADVVHRLAPLLDGLDGVGETMSIFADDTRFKILVALSRSELCVCDVGALLQASSSSVSYHLRNLFRVGAVKYRREGKLVYYRLTDDAIATLIGAVLRYTGRPQ